MVRFALILYLEPYYKSKFYKSLERYLFTSLAHYGLHEGTMAPPHCAMTDFIQKGDYLPASHIAKLLDKVIEQYSPYNRPVVGKLNPVNNSDIREGVLKIPLNVKSKGFGGVIRKPYEYCLKEFRYDGKKHCNLDIVPRNMDCIPLAYNNDKWLTRGKKLSAKELEGLWDLAQEIIDFKDAETCAWNITLHQVRRSIYFNEPHIFAPAPVKRWEVIREYRPVRKWLMDWP